MCRDLEIPGSHIKHHVCGTPEQWSDVRARLSSLRENRVASELGPTGENVAQGPSMSFQRY